MQHYVRARVDGVERLSKRVACAAVRALPSTLRFFLLYAYMQGGLAACKTLASF